MMLAILVPAAAFGQAFVFPPAYHAIGLLIMCIGLSVAFPELHRVPRLRYALAVGILLIGFFARVDHGFYYADICNGITGWLYYVGGCWAY